MLSQTSLLVSAILIAAAIQSGQCTLDVRMPNETWNKYISNVSNSNRPLPLSIDPKTANGRPSALYYRVPGDNRHQMSVVFEDGNMAVAQLILNAYAQNVTSRDVERTMTTMAYLHELLEFGRQGPPGGFSIGEDFEKGIGQTYLDDVAPQKATVRRRRDVMRARSIHRRYADKQLSLNDVQRLLEILPQPPTKHRRDINHENGKYSVRLLMSPKTGTGFKIFEKLAALNPKAKAVDFNKP